MYVCVCVFVCVCLSMHTSTVGDVSVLTCFFD